MSLHGIARVERLSRGFLMGSWRFGRPRELPTSFLTRGQQLGARQRLNLGLRRALAGHGQAMFLGELAKVLNPEKRYISSLE